MRVKILLFIAFVVLFFGSPLKAFADDDFDISTVAKYNVALSGVTTVTQTISIKNKKDFVYTPSYTISIGFKDIHNLRAYNGDGPLQTTLKEDKNNDSIEVDFSKRVVGIGNVNQFTVAFDTSEIAKLDGSVSEVSIPGLAAPNDYTSYTAQVVVPSTFGPPNIIKPYKVFSPGQNYTFNLNEIGKSGIFIIFGESKFYTFNLTYHIEDSEIVPVKTEVALIPQTSYQDVRIKDINPAPQDLYQDRDGNWLAVYSLLPHEKKTINATVVVKVFSKPIFDLETPASVDVSANKYWEVDDPKIKNLAQQLKTPQAIYDYVVNSLTYSFKKVADNNVRVGARGVLARPDFAVCLEFTDLYVALARAAGIPARAVEGYANTDNSTLRPLSLVQDVLHSWPEYYDETLKTWVMVDPTWGNTTHGMDYFNTLDFDHVAFVIEGADSSYPVPAGSYKLDGNTKDVKVTVGGQEEFTDNPNVSFIANFPSRVLSGFPIGGSITIKNTGNVPIRNQELDVASDLSPSSQVFNVDTILPYGVKTISLQFEKTPFLTTRTFKVKISFNGKTILKNIEVGLFPDYYLIFLGGVITIGSIIVAEITYKTWRIYFSRRK